jgi:hypothetical protein
MSKRDSNLYELKTKEDKGYFYEEKLDVSCNRKLVKSVLETKRSSKLEKLNKIVNAED